MLVSKSLNVEERTSNEGYQRCPELLYCGLRTVFVNSGLQSAGS